MKHGAACDYPSWRPPAGIRLVTTPERPCPYLPGRMMSTRAFLADDLPQDLYLQLMDAGFRRSGEVVYQPVCRGCRRCLQLRVPTHEFVRSKSQRRVWRRNQDLRVTAVVPRASVEKYDLYCRYQRGRHDGVMLADMEDFMRFLYYAPIYGAEMEYRTADGRLIGVGICDLAKTGLSSVYFYFDPAESRRSLGTFSILYEIEAAQKASLAYYYLGYWVEGCREMEYKALFRPHEVLEPSGEWRKVV